MIEYDCPQCDEPIEVKSGPVTCPQCKARLLLDCDAEFVDGMWRDRSKLIVQEFKPLDFT